jgi:hypothetical protein
MYTKLIRINDNTSKRLEKQKVIPTESYDSIINRILDRVE